VARLFITPREMDFISDLTKEVTKDVIGQTIFYYKVREDVSEVHEIYEEAIEKVFDPPVEVDARVQWNPAEIKTGKFGYEATANIEVYLHHRDMIDKDINVQEGDYFSFGSKYFEITSIKFDKIMFGQVEHVTGFVVVGKQARKGQINKKPIGPTGESFTEEDSMKDTFEQQRGFEKNSEGKTNDKRDLIDSGKLEKPITGPKKVRPNPDSSFYGDDC
tara:strand:+ start:553 stop:1206 length:654 start_codon:yes stop_codon:yes gene_type:complete